MFIVEIDEDECANECYHASQHAQMHQQHCQDHPPNLFINGLPLATFLGEDDAVCLRELLNGVFVGGNGHDWNTRYPPHPLLQSFVTRGNNVTSVLSHPLHHTIIRICPLVHAGKTGEARILGNLQSHPVLPSQLLQLPNDTISDTWNDSCIQRLHRCIHNVQLVLDAKVDEIGVQEDVVWWSQCRVVPKVQTARDLFNMMNLFPLPLLSPPLEQISSLDQRVP